MSNEPLSALQRERAAAAAVHRGATAEAVVHLTDAVALHRAARRVDDATRCAVAVAHLHLLDGAPAQAWQALLGCWADQPREASTQAVLDECAALVHSALGDLVAAEQHSSAATCAADATGQGGLRSRVYQVHATVLCQCKRPAEALRWAQKAEGLLPGPRHSEAATSGSESWEDRQAVHARGVSMLTLARVLLASAARDQSAQLHEALELVRDARGWLRVAGTPDDVDLCSQLEGDVRVALGDVLGALQAYDRALAGLHGRPAVRADVLADWARLALEHGSPERALGRAVESALLLDAVRRRLPTPAQRRSATARMAGAWSVALEAADRLQDPRSVAELVESLHAFGTPLPPAERRDPRAVLAWSTMATSLPDTVRLGAPAEVRMPWGGALRHARAALQRDHPELVEPAQGTAELREQLLLP